MKFKVGLLPVLSVYLCLGAYVSALPNQAAADAQTEGKYTLDDALEEVQKTSGDEKGMTLALWFPPEYFVLGNPQFKGSDEYKALVESTVFLVAVVQIGAFGAMDFLTPDEIRSTTRMHDAEGNEYEPLEQPPNEVMLLAEMMKIQFAAAMGEMGKNMAILVFPGRHENGERLANPTAKGRLSLTVTDMAEEERVLTWELPLTTLSPPKFCPVGNERVEVRWNYCPWHGVALDESNKNQQ